MLDTIYNNSIGEYLCLDNRMIIIRHNIFIETKNGFGYFGSYMWDYLQNEQDIKDKTE